MTLEPLAKARIPVGDSEFQLYAFDSGIELYPHLALVMGDLPFDPTLVRIHSECLTGDLFASSRCDCGGQLQGAIDAIKANKSGMIIYLRQEGRGIGLIEKLKAYNLQDQGLDTINANLELGHDADPRDYTVAGKILQFFECRSVELMTNNPQKIDALKEFGFSSVRRRPLQPSLHRENEKYLETKVNSFGHLIDLSKARLIKN